MQRLSLGGLAADLLRAGGQQWFVLRACLQMWERELRTTVQLPEQPRGSLGFLWKGEVSLFQVLHKQSVPGLWKLSKARLPPLCLERSHSQEEVMVRHLQAR